MSLPLWILLLTLGSSGRLSGQGIEIHKGSRSWRVEARRHQGRLYYKLGDLLKVIHIRSRERGGLLTLRGERGRLVLVEGRPLLRLEDQYVLLEAPPWKRRRGEWYVTEDFLSKVLPLIVNRKLSQISPHVYRLEEVARNRVQVRLSRYPDHLRIVFESSRQAPVRVLEREGYLEVRFSDYRVEPHLPPRPPEGRLARAVEFDSSDVYGLFRIRKGPRYQSYRHFSLKNPWREVVDLYGPPQVASGAIAPPPALPGAGRPPGLEPSAAVADLEQGRHDPRTVMIDPGHGGEDWGGFASEEAVEKTFNLELAARLQDELHRRGYRGILTRTRDVELASEQRSSLGNYYHAAAYLSIHVGSAPSPALHGPQVYVHLLSDSKTEEARPMSEALAAGRVPALVPWRRAQESFHDSSRRLAGELQAVLNALWGSRNRVVEVPLAVLEPVRAPAVLVEAGFLSNPGDLKRIQSKTFQYRLAAVMADTLIRFLEEQRSGQELEGR